jgi:hypothetical protein
LGSMKYNRTQFMVKKKKTINITLVMLEGDTRVM